MNSRFRRSAVGKAGSFAQLGDLMEAAKSLPNPAVGPTANAFGIAANDDDLTCIWKVMSDGKGRTVTELTATLADFPDQIEPDDVESMLRILVTNGFATRQPNRSDEPIYILKKGVTMAQIGAQDNKTTKLRGPASGLQGLDPRGSINLSEGIMVCLWKVMSDFKPRTQDQIFEMLVAYGINKEVAKDAFIRAKVNHKWFEWHGQNKHSTPHRLKKHIKMPPVENVDPATLKQKMTPGAVRMPTPAAAPMALPVSLGGQRGRHQFFNESSQPRLDVGTSKLQEESVKDLSVKPSHGQITISKDDPLDVAIWKVMSDYEPYSASEVGLLLQEYGHNHGTVRVRISQLFLHDGFHWFTREQRRTASGNKEYVYVLNENIPMPGTKATEPAAPSAPQKQPELNLQDQTNNEEKGNEMKGQTTALGDKLQQALGAAGDKPAAPPAPAKPPVVASQPANDPAPKLPANEQYFKLVDLPDTDLLRFHVTVRNTAYSFKQADQLVRELLAQGFGEGKFRTTPQSLLQTSYRIGQASFTGNELEDLTKQLLESGFGVDE